MAQEDIKKEIDKNLVGKREKSIRGRNKIENPKEKKNFYMINWMLLSYYFILKTIDVISTWYLISNYGLESERNPIIRLLFGNYGLDIYLFYIPIIGFVIYNYHYRKDSFVMKAELYALFIFLVIYSVVVYNNLLQIYILFLIGI